MGFDGKDKKLTQLAPETPYTPMMRMVDPSCESRLAAIALPYGSRTTLAQPDMWQEDTTKMTPAERGPNSESTGEVRVVLRWVVAL